MTSARANGLLQAGTRGTAIGTWLLISLTLWAGIDVSPAGQAETVIRVDAARFQVEIAATEVERERGLMFRTQLPPDHGMLFIQPEAAPTAFWMKNTYIPLDILYFDSAGRLVELHSNVPPCTTPACPVIASAVVVKYILEINGGSAHRLGLEPGAQLHLD